MPSKVLILTLIAIIIASNFFSCDPPNEEKKEFKVCDCKGKAIQNVDERGVVIRTAHGFKIFSESLGYVSICEDLPESFRTGNYPLVRYTGKTIASCGKEIDYYEIWLNEVELDTIIAIDSIGKIGDTIIDVFYSTNEWGEAGWGYFVTKGNFKIKQDKIPGIEGNKQFASMEEARLFAIMVAFRLNSTNDFPGITPNDFCYLQKYVCG